MVDSQLSAHCRACKAHVPELLSALYGTCHINRSFPWSTRPPDYANTPIGAHLERIRAALGDWRGHREFIKSAQLPPCDYVVSDPPFIVEFDESQHFSRSRLVTLANYPENFPLGFSPARWQELCRAIDASDSQPFDRDERRAWYDTLRDLLPSLHGFRPTVRFYAGEVEWCGLTTSEQDLAKVRMIVEGVHLTKK